ncbi:MAG: DNA lyase [Candidatus Aenigmarchaeota archaeon]|nr:DNA lyase [Candidatus Aenigmarchaeota archaeon]
MEELENLKILYEKRKGSIRSFVNSCSIKDDNCLFGELCFCIMTPQSRAKYCRAAVEKLKKDKKLFKASEKELLTYMTGVRFPMTKAQRIISAREKFPELKKRLGINQWELRLWLAENIKGLGMKESTHFMRNIGFRDMAIIDVHIQNFLRKLGKIKENKSLTKKRYLELEKIFLDLAKEAKISPEELDIAIWLYQSKEQEFYG